MRKKQETRHADAGTGKTSQTPPPAPAFRETEAGCRFVDVRPPHRVVRDAHRLPGADDRLRFVEDRRRPQAPYPGDVYRPADAGRAGTGARQAGTAGARTAGERPDRLAEHPEPGFERKRAERKAQGRPRYQCRGAQRCRSCGRGAHACQPRGLRTGARRGARHPPAPRRRGGFRAPGSQGQGARHGFLFADRPGADVPLPGRPGLQMRRRRRSGRDYGQPCGRRDERPGGRRRGRVHALFGARFGPQVAFQHRRLRPGTPARDDYVYFYPPISSFCPAEA